uniref:Tudor domain containing 6 n=1 Tax=Neogobius melanostomus TaxID=47308 RepID=A0A8C6TI75_9GOBI
MSSIQGLPDQGSDVSILITRVHLHPLCELVEFWAKFSQNGAADYMGLAKDIQSPGTIFREFEGSPGDQCLAQKDGTWYRARVVSQNASQYVVFLIDKGMTYSTNTSKLAWGKREYFDLPPEVEFCVLANILPVSPDNRWSPVALEFLKSLTGKSVKVHVQNFLRVHRMFVLHIPCISKQMYEMGFARKLSAEMFQDFLLSSLQAKSGPTEPQSVVSMGTGERLHNEEMYMYPELQAGTVETVVVTEVTNPLRIFCQLKVFSQELKKLSEQLTQCCDGRIASCTIDPEMIGFPCAARGSDGKWYRSVLQQVFPANKVVEVLNVDYGTKQIVHVENVRPLASEFFRMPVVTYNCSLHGIIDQGVGWTTSQIDYLRTLLLFKTIIAKFEYQSITEGVYYATLYGDENSNINNLFGSKEKACELFTKIVLDKALSVHVLVQADGCHFVKLTDPDAQGEKDLAKLLFAAGFAEKNDTKRLSKGKTNSQVALPSTVQYTGMSFQHLNAAISGGIERKCATFKEQMFSIGSILDVNVSYIESPNDFWCQLVQSTGHLKLLMYDMQTHYRNSEFQPLVETACAARHPENGMWYRALIVQKRETPHVDVLFIDYGQTETVSVFDLRKIEKDFLSLPGQAFRCSLFNPVDPTSAINDWTEEAVDRFHTFVGTAANSFVILKCTIYAVMYSEQKIVFNIVDLETPFESICTSLVNLVKSTPPKVPSGPSFRLDTYYYSTHNVKTGTEEQVIVTSVKNVRHFYCQLQRNADTLKDLQLKVAILCAQLQRVTVPPVFGTLCFAKYTDGHWYRGQIKATKPSIQVHFVDYGDTLEVVNSDLLPIPKEASEIMAVPVQALLCSLSDIPDDIPLEANSWFETSSTEGEFKALIVAKEPDGKLVVELYQGKIQVNSKIKKLFELEMLTEGTVVCQDSTSVEITVKPAQARTNVSPTQAYAELDDAKHITKDTMSFVPKTSHSKTLTDSLERKSVPHPSLTTMSKEITTESWINDNDVLPPKIEKLPKLSDLAPRSITNGMVTDVYISHCNGPLSFYVQLVKEEDDIFSIVNELNDPETSSISAAITEVHPGDLVQAEFTDDSSWYRAVVKEKQDKETVLVEFVDFGNTASIPLSKMCKLDKAFLRHPAYSTHCMLKSAAGLKVLEPEVSSAFELAIGNIGEKQLKCKFTQLSGTVWEVILEDGGVEVECKISVKSQPDDAEVNKVPPTAKGQQLDVYITAITDAQIFWCQSADSEELDQITESLADKGEAADSMNLCSLSVGSPCIALYSEDQLWYRAEILNKTGDEVSLFFVDYGNKSQVKLSDVRQITPEMIQNPVQAFLCELQGFDSLEGSWKTSAEDELSVLTADQLLQLTVCKVTKEDDKPKCYVRLECEGQIINESMRKFWRSNASETSIETQTLTTAEEAVPIEKPKEVESCDDGGADVPSVDGSEMVEVRIEDQTGTTENGSQSSENLKELFEFVVETDKGQSLAHDAHVSPENSLASFAVPLEDVEDQLCSTSYGSQILESLEVNISAITTEPSDALPFDIASEETVLYCTGDESEDLSSSYEAKLMDKDLEENDLSLMDSTGTEYMGSLLDECFLEVTDESGFTEPFDSPCKEDRHVSDISKYFGKQNVCYCNISNYLIDQSVFKSKYKLCMLSLLFTMKCYNARW